MKHSDPTTLTLTPAHVRAALAMVGVTASDGQADKMVRHALRVLEANRRTNLTRITEPQLVLWLHIVDSLAWLPLLPPPEGHVVDLGSGAGYPGIPLAVLLGGPMILCESIRKKADFLHSVTDELHLPCEVFGGRAEELALERPRLASAVVARAVSSLGSLVELAAPLLRQQGRLYALKGRLDEVELSQADQVAAVCGMRRAEVRAYSLPTGEQRTIVSFTAIGPPKVPLPRRSGLAQRQPLTPSTPMT